MAHLDHYTKAERVAIVKEASRDLKEYRNYVDPDRTHLNYTVMNSKDGKRIYGSDVSPKFVMSRVNFGLKGRVYDYQRETGCQVRKNSVTLSSWVVQCPEILRGDVEVEKRFFDEVNGFMMKELGKENVIAMFVHFDETTPHCHVHTVPCGHNRDTGKPAIGSNAVYTRGYLKDFHVRFNDHMEAVFGMKNLIVTPERVTSQKGNLSLTEFKKAKLTEEVENLEICKKKGVRDVLALQDTQRDLEQSTNALRARMDELEARNQILTKRNIELQHTVKRLEEDKQGYERILKDMHKQYREVTQKIGQLWNRLLGYEERTNDINKKRLYRNLRNEIQRDEDVDLEL